jgi:homoserine kinase type II
VLADARVDHGGSLARQIQVCLYKVVIVSHSARDDTAASGFSERTAAVIVASVALFTALAQDQLAEIGARYRIGQPLETKAIAAGTINSNFSLQTSNGRYFLRVNEGKSLEDVAWEAQLLAWLAHHGFPTPAPLLADNGVGYLSFQDKLLTLFPWANGHHLSSASVTSSQAAALGQALGQLHRLGELAPPSWRRRSIYDQAHLRVRFDGVVALGDPALASTMLILQRAMEEAEEAQVVRRASTETIVHGDLFRDNVLWDGARLVAILDFEQASGGTVAYDLAVCLNDWCWDGTPRPELVAAVLEGYQRERTLTAADVRALPVEVRAAAMRFTITRITDVYLARVNNPEKDFRDFLARLEAWQSPLLGQFLGSV